MEIAARRHILFKIGGPPASQVTPELAEVFVTDGASPRDVKEAGIAFNGDSLLKDFSDYKGEKLTSCFFKFIPAHICTG